MWHWRKGWNERVNYLTNRRVLEAEETTRPWSKSVCKLDRFAIWLRFWSGRLVVEMMRSRNILDIIWLYLCFEMKILLGERGRSSWGIVVIVLSLVWHSKFKYCQYLYFPMPLPSVTSGRGQRSKRLFILTCPWLSLTIQKHLPQAT